MPDLDLDRLDRDLFRRPPPDTTSPTRALLVAIATSLSLSIAGGLALGWFLCPTLCPY